MKILLSNDDGISSKGLKAIAEKLSVNNEILVVAPSNNCSGLAHSFTVFKPISVKQVYDYGCKAFKVDGSPVDCVKFAFLTQKDFRPEVVVAGINRGHNVGSDILYSGTVSLALEGAYFNRIAFSFSAFSPEETEFDLFADYAVKIINQILPIAKKGDVFNINFPDSRVKIKGIKITGLCKVIYNDEFVKLNENEYILQGEPINYDKNNPVLDDEPEIDCDYEWIKRGYITITPLVLDKTNFTLIEKLKELCIQL